MKPNTEKLFIQVYSENTGNVIMETVADYPTKQIESLSNTLNELCKVLSLSGELYDYCLAPADEEEEAL